MKCCVVERKSVLFLEARALGMALLCPERNFFFSLCNRFHIKGDKQCRHLSAQSSKARWNRTENKNIKQRR